MGKEMKIISDKEEFKRIINVAKAVGLLAGARGVLETTDDAFDKQGLIKLINQALELLGEIEICLID